LFRPISAPVKVPRAAAIHSYDLALHRISLSD
jgi:hypothetical protein